MPDGVVVHTVVVVTGAGTVVGATGGAVVAVTWTGAVVGGGLATLTVVGVAPAALVAGAVCVVEAVCGDAACDE